MIMDLSFKLEQAKFEGPMDLLLHLIDKNKMDIMDIPIAELTDQYFEYLDLLQRDLEEKAARKMQDAPETNPEEAAGGIREQRLDSMSDFLVMAATLLDIKAKLLLPPEKDEEGEEIDPRSELVQKLLEYKMYKYMSYELKDREDDASRTMFHRPSIPKEVKNFREPVDLDELFKGVSLITLRAVFLDVMKRQEDRIDPIRSTFGQIEREKVNAREVMQTVQKRIRRKGKCTFRSLLSTGTGRDYVVVTFLTILELMRIGRVDAVQENPFGEIYITVREPEQWDQQDELQDMDLEYDS